MSEILSFPPAVPVECIDEAYFEKYADAALLLKCFESVKDALEVICDPELAIEIEDDTHVSLLETFWAIKVLFRRKTGHDANQVAQKHWEAMGRHLLGGAALPDQGIPIVSVPISPLPLDAFGSLTNQQLACAAFNYSDQVREAIMTHSPEALAMSQARVTAINATTALRKLVLRMSGGSVEAMGARIGREPGETLQ